jgi:hypothetical protein
MDLLFVRAGCNVALVPENSIKKILRKFVNELDKCQRYRVMWNL